MGHDHSHGCSHDPNTYWSEQICTLGACGTLGIVAILITFQGALNTILTPTFHVLVLLSGITLLTLTVIRGIALWVEVGQPQQKKAHEHDACCGHHEECHDHKHEPALASASKGSASAEMVAAASDSPSPAAVSLAVVAPPQETGHEAHGHHHHDHAHGHAHDHGHGDGHQHGWAPWRYAVLLVPVVLYSLGLPGASQGPSLNLVKSRLAQESLESSDFVTMAVAGDEVLPLEFNTLKSAAYMPDQRERYEGKMGKLKGQFVPGNDAKTFGLVRVKMTCCYADAMPLNVTIISRKDLAGIQPMQWVEVTGQIQFRKRQGRDEYLPVIQLRDQNGLVPTEAPANPYL